MKYIFSTLAIFLIFRLSLAQAPAFEWIVGGYASDPSIAVDDSGYIYLTANFSGIIDLGDTVLISTNYPNDTVSDVIIAKYNSFSILLWVNTIRGYTYKKSTSITVDDYNNVYVAGNSHSNQLIIESDTIENTYPAIFISKFDNNGSYKWTNVYISNSTSFSINSICYSPDGFMYSTGYFLDQIVFNSDTLISENNTYDIFVLKTDTNGNFLWAIREGGNAYDAGNCITTDLNGNIFLTGYYSIVAVTYKYDSNGYKLWSKDGIGGNYPKGYGITSDSDGNIYVTGSFSNSIDFDNFHLVDAINRGFFLVKYNTNGDVVWAKCSQGSNSSYCYGYRLATDTNCNLFITGYYKGEFLIIGTDTLYNTSISTNDVFIAKYDTSGNEIWAKSFGSLSDDYGSEILSDNFGNIYCTGNLYYQAVIEGFSLNSGIFLAKINNLNSNPLLNNSDVILLYPNPAKNFLFIDKPDKNGNYLLSIFEISGKEAFTINLQKDENKINLQSLNKGLYILKLSDENIILVTKFIRE